MLRKLLTASYYFFSLGIGYILSLSFKTPGIMALRVTPYIMPNSTLGTENAVSIQLRQSFCESRQMVNLQVRLGPDITLR